MCTAYCSLREALVTTDGGIPCSSPGSGFFSPTFLSSFLFIYFFIFPLVVFPSRLRQNRLVYPGDIGMAVVAMMTRGGASAQKAGLVIPAAILFSHPVAGDGA